MIAQSEANIRLQAKWLLIVRLVWVVGFIALAAMYSLGFLAVHEALSTVCQEEPCTLREQVRHTKAVDQVMSWPGPPIGFADPLRREQVETLERYGLTIDQYAWLGALQMGIPVLVYLLIAAGLFWRKSNDWMVLFVSAMVATFPLQDMPLPFILVVRQPAWEWVFTPATILALSSLLIFPLIFPTGRFVPRWTRWMGLFDLCFGTLVTIFRYSVLQIPGAARIVVFYIILSFCTGVYAQLYRYIRVATLVERQQLKWVIVGIASFISLSIGVLIPLNRLLANQAGSMDPARALVLSATLNTLFRMISLFIPISIVISVLRYRLWDIDIIISRTLVYGTLSAGIVVTYILLIGLLGMLLKTYVSLAAAFLTAVLTIPFLQPLRLRLQRAVNQLTFGGRNAPGLQHEIVESQSDVETPLRPRWLQVMHSAWFVSALLTAIFLIGSIPVYYSRYTHPILSDPYKLGQFNVPFQFLVGVGALVESFIGFALAVLLFWRKPNDRMGLFVSFFFLITTLSNSYGYFHSAYVGAWSPLNLFSFVTFPLWILLFCIFPDGRFVPRWTRWLFLVSILASFSYFAFPEWFFILQFTAGPQFILVTYAQLYRYRHESSDAERQQTKWVVFGLLLTMMLSLIASLIYKRPSGPLINIIPLTVAIAILRSRLWNIDLILNRTLVYGALTAGIVALYVILVGALSLLSQTTGNLLISLLATGLIAILFQPLRERLQRGVNRLVYGERDDPYAALSRLGRRLEASLAPEEVLPTIVTTVREAFKIPYAAIYLKEKDDSNKIIAESASPYLRVEGGRIQVPGMGREGLCIPLVHQGETLGYIVLGPRTPSEAFNNTDLRLLDDLAPQVGIAVHALRLTADLQRSREQLVLAREEERRRLRRDLHDGLGPQLAGLGLKLETLRNRLKDDPPVDALLADLAKRTQEATADIRHLVYELRPPTLDELGLLMALRESVTQYSQNGNNGVNIAWEAPESLPALPAAVEVATYRIVQEAMTNVIRHAEASTCSVRLRMDEPAGLLCLEIEDDGKGIPIQRRAGVGLNSMRERAEELGGTLTIRTNPTGGTSLLVQLPCRVDDRKMSELSQEEP